VIGRPVSTPPGKPIRPSSPDDVIEGGVLDGIPNTSPNVLITDQTTAVELLRD